MSRYAARRVVDRDELGLAEQVVDDDRGRHGLEAEPLGEAHDLVLELVPVARPQDRGESAFKHAASALGAPLAWNGVNSCTHHPDNSDSLQASPSPCHTARSDRLTRNHHRLDNHHDPRLDRLRLAPPYCGRPAARRSLHLTHLGTSVLNFGDDTQPVHRANPVGRRKRGPLGRRRLGLGPAAAGRRRDVGSARPRHQPEAARRSRRGPHQRRSRGPICISSCMRCHGKTRCSAHCMRSQPEGDIGNRVPALIWRNRLDRRAAPTVANITKALQRMLSCLGRARLGSTPRAGPAQCDCPTACPR